MSGPLLARFRNTSRSVTNSALKTLFDKKYLGRHYEKSYKFLGKGASYYLVDRGLRRLRDEPGINKSALRAMSKNKLLSTPFVDHNLDIAEAYLALRNSYPGTFHMFTKSEQGSFDYFPNPKPDLYLNRIKPTRSHRREYMLDVLTHDPLFIIKKRIAVYMEHYDDGEWEAAADTDYPAILIVVKDSRVEKQLQEHTARRLEGQGLDGELSIYTTTIKALLDEQSQETAVWSDVLEPEDLVSFL
jgi:hypothetical protein